MENKYPMSISYTILNSRELAQVQANVSAWCHHMTRKTYTVAHKGGIFLFYPNLWNYFKNNLKIIDLDQSIHSQILLNNNLTMCVFRDC